MPEIRLFVPDPVQIGEELWLQGERAHYLSRVLRVKVGDALLIFDGRGGEYTASIGKIERQRVQLQPRDYLPRSVESALSIRLIQGISRGDRMDFVVQKATELGVHRISPANTRYSVVRLDAGRSQKKTDHWERIAQSACEQCGRNTLPLIDAPTDLNTILAAPAGDAAVVLVPGTSKQLADLPDPASTLTVLIGPEGGLTDAERSLAIDQGYVPVSLGPRILRTETAALAAIAVAQSRFGDLRNPANKTWK